MKAVAAAIRTNLRIYGGVADFEAKGRLVVGLQEEVLDR